MKKLWIYFLSVSLLLTACTGSKEAAPATSTESPETDTITIELSGDQILVDGTAASTNSEDAVYTANDIIYYEDGKDFTYGEGDADDAHSAEEAASHTVVHISQAGTYTVSGKMSKGQIAVDLGKDAKEDPNAVVTLILNGVDITCTVAPAVIFYNVYECGSTDTESASKDVDTSAAGANVIIADGSANAVTGSHVARIYKPESVELNEDGTEVSDAKKLHKYDAAFYSKMSMNVNGGEAGNGILNIQADNEGLDTELHLTINGGNINIVSGNDGINTNEDGVSVTTVNGGNLTITVTGETGEGDGIDSNGWLVINGGSVSAAACGSSMDSGIDSDMGIHINGGTVLATGNMLDRIEEGSQTHVTFMFAAGQNGEDLHLKSSDEKTDISLGSVANPYSILLFSSPELAEGEYTIWSGDTQLSAMQGNQMMPGGGMGGGFRPQGIPGDFGNFGDFDPDNFDPSQMPEFPNGGMNFPGGNRRPQMPEGMEPPAGGFGGGKNPFGDGSMFPGNGSFGSNKA